MYFLLEKEIVSKKSVQDKQRDRLILFVKKGVREGQTDNQKCTSNREINRKEDKESKRSKKMKKKNGNASVIKVMKRKNAEREKYDKFIQKHSRGLNRVPARTYIFACLNQLTYRCHREREREKERQRVNYSLKNHCECIPSKNLVPQAK